MKCLLSAALALSLLGGTAAVAAPYDRGGYNSGYYDQDYNAGYGDRDRRDNYRGRGDNNGAAVVAGIGILALAAILASQNHRNHRHYHQGWHNGRYGYRDGYNRGYNYDYNNRDYGYGDGSRNW